MKALVATLLLAGGGVPGFVYWPAAGWPEWNRRLAGRMDGRTAVSEELGRFGNHWSSITRRAGPGEAEAHGNADDIFIVQSGEAELVTGGSLVSPRQEAPGEWRAPGIQNGQRARLAPGDFVYIPAGLPHQVIAGRELLYFVIKVAEESPRDAARFLHLPREELQAAAQRLIGQAQGQTAATATLGDWGTHALLLVYRAASGEAEEHERQVDYFWILSGEALVRAGGRAVQARKASPGETRGAGIEGGEQITMRAGDLAHIPAGTPHQALVRGTLCYAVVKVQQ